MAKIARVHTSFYKEDLDMLKSWMLETGSSSYHDLLVKIDIRAFHGKHVSKELDRRLAEPAIEEKLPIPFQ